MALALIHERLATAVLLFSLILGLWGLGLAFARRGVSSNYWGILATGEVLFLAQGILGAIQWLSGARPERGIHVLYGVVTALTLPAAYALTKGRDDRRAAWLYGLLGLFLAAIAWRASSTGG